MNEFSILILITVILIVIVLFNTAKVVPQRQEYIVERLGKFSRTLSAGLHLLVPFLDVVRYKRTLKEEVLVLFFFPFSLINNRTTKNKKGIFRHIYVAFMK